MRVLLRRHTSPRFDAVAEDMRGHVESVTEADVLERHLWSRGEDGFLREDIRFRKTPWGRWILSTRYLANDELVRRLRTTSGGEAQTSEALRDIGAQVGCEASVCSADPRLVVRGDRVRLAASELSDEIAVADDAGAGRFTTHLPLHSLKAVAASEPGGDWGPGAQEERIETLGWVRVDAKKKLNERMFVAQVQGDSMDDSRSGLVDGGYAIFELWPAGTKQDTVVLVRGAFKDPETGTFAVKKYRADARGTDGTHQSIRLVSLNPDKDRFPDIVLHPERDDDVTVVAKLVAALPAGALPRRPRSTVQVAGRRDTASEAGRRRIAARLQTLAQGLVSSEPGTTPAGTGDTSPTSVAVRAAEVVCFDDHLALEVGPTPLPSFAKQLRLLGDHDDLSVLGNNVRSARRRVRVGPSVSAWRWQAPDVDEDLLADELAALGVPGLNGERASLFRVDASGVGRRRKTPVLGQGERWRIVLPPVLAGDGRDLGHGWRVVELELGPTISPDIAQLLSVWGLEVRPAHPRVWTIGSRPVRWQASTNDELVPVYSTLSTIAVAIDGMATLFPGELTAFVASSSSAVHLPLPVGEQWTIGIDELREGAHLVEATPIRTASDVERACFVVEAGDPSLPAATITLRRGDVVSRVNDDGRLSLVEPFPALVAPDVGPVVVEGPPLWPLRLRIEAPGFRGTHFTACDDEGRLDLRDVLEGWRHVWEGRAFADLTIDAADLGVIGVQHRANRTVSSIVDAFAALVAEREKALPQLRQDLALYDDQWVRPILRLFGYEVEAVAPEALVDASAGVRAYLLHEWRIDETPPRRELSRICIVVPDRNGLDPLFIGAAHAFADMLMTKHRVRESMVTDGLHWSEHRRGSGLRRPRLWDVVALARERSAHKLEELLNELAVGV